MRSDRPAGKGIRWGTPTIFERLVGRALDAVFTLALFVILVGLLALAGSDPIDANYQIGSSDFEVMVPVFFVTGLLYEVIPTSRRGRTIGKLIVRTTVIRSDDGSLPGLGASFIRWLTAALPTTAFAVFATGLVPSGRVVAFAWGLFSVAVCMSAIRDGNRRGWHDKAAGTLVAKL